MIKQTQLSFKLGITNDEITPRAGLSIYAEFLRGFGIKKIIEACMPSPGSNRGYKAWKYIEPIMMMLYGGGRHIDDLREIVADKALRRLVDLKEIPSASTVGDWLKRMGGGAGIISLKQAIEMITKKAIRLHALNEYTLWSDPTLIEAEKREAKMSYKGFKGYKPILTAFRELPVILYHNFRDGNAMGDLVEAIEAAYLVLPEGKRIRHASLDSEFYSADVINLLMKKGTTFTIAVDKDHAVKEAIRGLQGWRPFKTEEGDEIDLLVHDKKGLHAYEIKTLTNNRLKGAKRL